MIKNHEHLDNYVFGIVYGTKLLFRGRDVNGNWVDEIITDWAPTYYIESAKGRNDGTGLFGESLRKYEFTDLGESKSWYREAKDSKIKIHGDISPEIQFFRQLPKTKPILPTELKTLFYDIETEIDPEESIRELTLNADKPITLISTYDNVTKKCHLFLYRDYNIDVVNSYSDDIVKGYAVEYHQYNTEYDMLLGFLNYYEEIGPHILSGWNTQGFDNVYMYRRLINVLGEKSARRLSPFGIIKKKTVEVYGKEEERIDIIGVADYDYLEIYKMYTYHAMPNYKLDTVASYELNCNKLSHEGSFQDFYTNHWDMFVAYNIRDTLLVYEIDKQTDLLSVAVSVSYMCGCNLNDTFGTIKKLDALTYNFVSDQGLVIPPTKHEEGETFPGGYVADPQVGRHTGIVSVDAASLYPSMIRMFNISPETLVHFDNLPENIQNLCLSINIEKFLAGEIDTSPLIGTPYTITGAGVVYDQTKKGIVPMIMESLFFGRRADKKKSLEHKANYLKAKESGGDPDYINSEHTKSIIMHNSQMAKKILLNSYFGSYGNANFRYYSLDHAKSITLSGQLGIRYVSQEINKWLKSKLDPSVDYIAYGDTDSIYLCLSALYKKFNIDPLDPAQYDKAKELLTRFTDGPLQDEINRITREWSDKMNCKENLLDMERESIAVRGGIFVAKKKYALMVDDLEGVTYTYDKPYMKIMGLEIAKAGKYSERIRDWLEELLTIILTSNETLAQQKISEWNKIFNKLPLEEIGILTGVNDVDKWLETNGAFKSGTPIGPKALVNHNRFLDLRGDYSVERLNAGDKIFYVPMRKGNPAGADTMGFVTWTGALLELDAWVDRVELWNKNFISPAEVMLKAVKWSPVKKNKLF